MENNRQTLKRMAYTNCMYYNIFKKNTKPYSFREKTIKAFLNVKYQVQIKMTRCDVVLI